MDALRLKHHLHYNIIDQVVLLIYAMGAQSQESFFYQDVHDDSDDVDYYNLEFPCYVIDQKIFSFQLTATLAMIKDSSKEFRHLEPNNASFIWHQICIFQINRTQCILSDLSSTSQVCTHLVAW